jgi:hypothetical protein
MNRVALRMVAAITSRSTACGDHAPTVPAIGAMEAPTSQVRRDNIERPPALGTDPGQLAVGHGLPLADDIIILLE